MVSNRASRLVLILAAASCAAASLLLPGGASACTTAVVSGKATADGRPLLWKNRDADDLHNQAVYRDDGYFDAGDFDAIAARVNAASLSEPTRILRAFAAAF